MSENYNKNTQIIYANREFEKAQMSHNIWVYKRGLLICYKFPPWGFKADQNFDNK